ncbi:MAG: cell wall hydrolase, partial [Candidatus Nanopelagicaceae bacterium]
MRYIAIVVLFLLLIPNTNGVKSIAPVVDEIEISQEDVNCLAKNIYYEAPAEPYLGKLAVATVTMNRVRHPGFPKTVCDVVYQRNSRGCQFSWTCGPKARFNNNLYNQSVEIAKKVLTTNIKVVSLDNALYFHNTKVKPNWSFAR